MTFSQRTAVQISTPLPLVKVRRPHNKAGPCVPTNASREHAKARKGGAKSVCSSVEPAPRCSFLGNNRHKFNLELYNRSMMITLELMRPCRKTPEISGFCTASEKFSTEISIMLQKLEEIPRYSQLNRDYKIAKGGIKFYQVLFKDLIKRMASESVDHQEEAIESALEFVDILFHNLRHFITIVEVLARETKERQDIPSLPSSSSLVDEDLTSSPVTLTDESLCATFAESSPSSNAESTSTTPPASSPISGHTASIENHTLVASSVNLTVKEDLSNAAVDELGIRISSDVPCEAGTLPHSNKNIFGKVAKSLRTRTNSFFLKSKISYAVVDPGKNFYTEIKAADPDLPYIDNQLPIPSEIVAAVRLGTRGEVKAGSLAALVFLLTTEHGVADTEYVNTFFTGFRIFSSPLGLVNELTKRWDEDMPDGLDVVKQRVWTDHRRSMRICVGRVVHMWLNDYWKIEHDNEVIEHLRILVAASFKKDLPPDLTQNIGELLDRRKRGEDERCRKKKMYMMQSDGKDVVSDRNFQMPEKFVGYMYSKLMNFDAPPGRIEFARQLTMKVSEMFQKIDSEDVVVFWRINNQAAPWSKDQQDVKKQQDEKQPALSKREIEAGKSHQAFEDFQQALGMWVSFSILKHLTPEERAYAICFWLDVSIHCLDYRNFSCASTIFNGIAHSSITRLRESVLLVPPASKLKFHILDRFFTSHGNYARVRNALEKTGLPTIPLTTPLVRDVLTVKEISDTFRESIVSERANEEVKKPREETKDEEKDQFLINLYGYRTMRKTIRCLDNCRLPYQYTKSIKFQKWLDEELLRFYYKKTNNGRTELKNAYELFHKKSLKRENSDTQSYQDLPIDQLWIYFIEGDLDENCTLQNITKDTTFEWEVLNALHKLGRDS